MCGFVRRLEVSRNYLCASVCQRQRYRSTDALSGARDQRYSSLMCFH
jgi:hypothetical protein